MLRSVLKIRAKLPLPTVLKRCCAVGKEKIEKAYSADMKTDYSRLLPEAKYGGENLVTLITGTGAGAHGAEYIKAIFEYVNAPIMFEEIRIKKADEKESESGSESDSSSLGLDEVVLSVQRNRYALNIEVMHDQDKKKDSLCMNSQLDLFVSVLHFFPFHGYKAKFDDVDITILTENIMGDNTKLEYEPVPGMVETLRICSSAKIRRFVNYTYDYCRRNGCKKIAFVHKFNEFPLSDGYFMREAARLHRQFPEIIIEDVPINDLALKLVSQPQQFDVICTSDRFGIIVASICSGVCGGPGLFCASNIGAHHAIFQPLENRVSIPLDEDGLSPYGVISAGIQLLLHLGYCECGNIIWKALIKTMIKDQYLTKKYCGNRTAEEVVCRVIKHIKHYKCK